MKNSTFLIIFLSFFVAAQEQNQIDSVVLSAKKIKEISIGHPLIHIEHDFGQSLGDDLSIQTGAYFKEYGNGMLSSISYRGLGAAHTGVFLEGIPINSGLTGQTDFNLLYPEGFNTIEFRTGGGGATFGSGAVGGSVHLNNELAYNKDFKGEISQKIASFDTYATNLGTSFSDDQNALKVNMYRLTSNNDYDYIYNNEEYTIENGAVETLITNLAYQRKINDRNHLKLSLNYALADRQLMESVGATSNQKQKDTNYNSVLSWMYTNKKYAHKLSQAFLFSEYQYFPNQDVSNYDFGRTENWVTKYDGSYKLTSKINLGAIGQFKHTKGKGSNIQEPSLDEGFVSVYGQYRYENLKQSLTVSKGVSSEFEIPFTLDYGIELNLKPIKLHGNITTNYRNPTFNDLYWVPGGNPNLKAEDGWATELGVEYDRLLSDRLYLNFRSNGFYSKFNDWIVWLPDVNQGGIFTPINIRNVESYGVELFSQLGYKIGLFEIDWKANYTFLKSLDEERNKQLIYTPKHKLNNQLQFKRENGFVQIQHQFVDEIYTSSDNLNKLDAFNLIDASIGYNLKINKIKTAIQVGVHNILDEEYQLILGRAMPKRNYSIQFNINF
ncbi:vitamin B12 transporter BtuB [Flavobacteriaceae bacterium UJ101]|nr:vitamin B12 transporter BtuB [Flavobacteriaceae bacterium UJ101]